MSESENGVECSICGSSIRGVHPDDAVDRPACADCDPIDGSDETGAEQ